MFKEFQNHLMYLPLKFPISILIKTIEEFSKNSAVSYSKDYYIDGQNIQMIFSKNYHWGKENGHQNYTPGQRYTKALDRLLGWI